jgi:hypothetical protein
MLNSILENERKRKQVEDERERLRQQQKKANDNEAYEKMQKIREQTEQQTKEKADKTLALLQYKDDLAKQELEKVKEAQERRRRIKAIRKEAFDIAAFRKMKADEYRKQQLEQDIQDKAQRSQAIKRGFHILDHMRNSMKDIMLKTNMDLKDQFDRLRHTGEFAPDRVVETALAVSNQILFPRLKQQFGIEENQDNENQHGKSSRKLNSLSPSATKQFFRSDDEEDEDGGGGGGKMNLSASLPLFPGDRTMPHTAKSTSQRGRTADSSSSHHPKTKHHHYAVANFEHREESATLKIQQLTKDRLKESLFSSMVSESLLFTICFLLIVF